MTSSFPLHVMGPIATLPVGKFKAALSRYQAASFSSKFMKFALFTSHKTFSMWYMFDQVFNQGIIQSCLLHFRQNFMTHQLTSSACCSVIGCNTRQHSTRNQKITCQFFVVASCRTCIVVVYRTRDQLNQKIFNSTEHRVAPATADRASC